MITSKSSSNIYIVYREVLIEKLPVCEQLLDCNTWSLEEGNKIQITENF